jgi:ribonucleoside-diphosphate reductase alpha chain
MAETIHSAAEQTTTAAAAHSHQSSAPGLHFSRYFTKPGVNPYDELTWEFRDAIIQDFKGRLVFEQKAVEVPSDWSVTAAPGRRAIRRERIYRG